MLSKWLKNVLKSNDTPEVICSKAYYDWKLSGFYEVVRREARQGGAYRSYFENIRHLISRLNHTMKAIVFLIKARDKLLLLIGPFGFSGSTRRRPYPSHCRYMKWTLQESQEN